MAHKHIYDAQGRQLCCTREEEKIYTKAGAKEIIHNEGCCSGDDHGHDHSNVNDSVFKLFLPAIISLLLLLAGIAMDNWFLQTWFTDGVRIIWYVAAYVPVGLPVLKEAVESIGDRKSTRLNSSHVKISYAVFCLKKKTLLLSAMHQFADEL